MTGPDLCPNCKRLHFRNDPCIVRKPTRVQDAKAMKAEAVATVVAEPEQEVQILRLGHSTKRTRGRPRTITDMKVYKAMKQREYRARNKNAE